MARARSIKTGFFKNDDLAECSLGVRRQPTRQNGG